MALNPFFQQGSSGEQSLVQSLINEQLRMYGVDIHYMPRKYLTALVKRQWGMNLIKFQGVKLPGGVELNGRQIYDDAEKELERIREMMSNSYELPPLDMIG